MAGESVDNCTKQDKMILVDFGLSRHDKIIMNDTEPDC